MSSVLSMLSYSAVSDMDMLKLNIDDRDLLAWYQDGFKLAQDIRVACKQAMAYEQTAINKWREMFSMPDGELPTAHCIYRRSNMVPTLSHWETAIEGPLIVLVFNGKTGGNFEIKMHFSDGLKLHNAIRMACQDAKLWSGDISKIKRTVGFLTDAEENYRLGR